MYKHNLKLQEKEKKRKREKKFFSSREREEQIKQNDARTLDKEVT